MQSGVIAMAIAFVFLAGEPSLAQDAGITSAGQRESKVHLAPVSFEWPFVNEQGKPMRYELHHPTKFTLDPSNLQDYSDYVEEGSDGLLELREIHGIYVVTPRLDTFNDLNLWPCEDQGDGFEEPLIIQPWVEVDGGWLEGTLPWW